MGSFSNDVGDGNGNGNGNEDIKKSRRFNIQNSSSARASHFLYISSP